MKRILIVEDDKNISEDEVKKAKLEEKSSRKKMEVSLTSLTKIKAEIEKEFR